MAGRGSKPGERRGGRKKGSRNKVTTALKDMVLNALTKAGGEEYLLKQARAKNPTAFMILVGKVLPIQQQQLGKDGRPIDPAHPTAPVISVTVGQMPNEER